MAPFKRCRFYEPDGTPIAGGCFKLATGSCVFVHPGDPQWSSALPPPPQFIELRGRGRGRRGGNASRGGGPTASGWGSSDLTTSTTPSAWAATAGPPQKEKDASLGWGNANWESGTEHSTGAFGSLSDAQSWATTVSTADTVGNWADTTASWGSSSRGAWGATESPGDSWASAQPTDESLADPLMAIDLGNTAPISGNLGIRESSSKDRTAGSRDIDMNTNVPSRSNAPTAQEIAPEHETTESDSEEVISGKSPTADDAKRQMMRLLARAVAAQHDVVDAENELAKRRRVKNSPQFEHPGDKARTMLDNLTSEPKRKAEEARRSFNKVIGKLIELDHFSSPLKDASDLADIRKDIEDLNHQMEYILSVMPKPLASHSSTAPTVPAKRRREEELELITDIPPRISKLEDKFDELQTYFEELVNSTILPTAMHVAPRSPSILSVEDGEILPRPSLQQNIERLSAQSEAPQAKLEDQLRDLRQVVQDLRESIEPPGVPPLIYTEDVLENIKSEITETIRADMADALSSLRTHLIMSLAEQQEMLCAKLWQDLQPILLLTKELYGIISAIDGEADTRN